MANPPWGPDASEFQESVNWAQIKADGASFGIVRASYGLYHEDRFYRANVAGVRGAGLKLGVYYYALPAQDPVAQAQHYARLLAEAGVRPARTVAGALASDLDFPAVLDLEATANESGSTDIHPWIHTLWQTLESLKIWPMIYTYRPWWDGHCGACAACGSHDLWIANYPNNPNPAILPPLPKAWTFAALWQYSDNTVSQGIAGPHDNSWCYAKPKPDNTNPFTEDEVLRIIQVKGKDAQAITNGLVKRVCGYPADEMWEVSAGLVQDRTVVYLSEDEWNRLPVVKG